MKRVYATTLKQEQVVAGSTPTTVNLPFLEPLKIRRMVVEISGFRIDGADDDTPYTNSVFFGSRNVLVTRGAVTGAPPSYPASTAFGADLVAPTQITAQAGSTFGPCDAYDDEGFGLTADGLSPLTMSYLAGTGGTGGASTAGYDRLSFIFTPETADQKLAMTLLISYEDQDIDLG